MTIKKLVDQYMKYGNAYGFFKAEFVLMKYLPDDNPAGYCYEVDPDKWQTLYDALKVEE